MKGDKLEVLIKRVEDCEQFYDRVDTRAEGLTVKELIRSVMEVAIDDCVNEGAMPPELCKLSVGGRRDGGVMKSVFKLLQPSSTPSTTSPTIERWRRTERR